MFGHATPTFLLKILSPDAKYYEGEAVSVSAANSDGPFDILAEHTNFFTLLSPGKLSIDTGKEKLEIPITGGVAKVVKQQVTLFVNI